MGTLEHLLEHHRDEVLEALDHSLRAGWEQHGPEVRGNLITLLGTIDGFRPKPNRPWDQVSTGLRLALRRLKGPRLRSVARVLAQHANRSQVELFLNALSGPAKAAHEVVEQAGSADTSAADGHEEASDPKPPPAPKVEAWTQALDLIDPAAHRHFLLFASAVADGERPGWRESAAAALDDLYARCLPSDTDDDASDAGEADPEEPGVADATNERHSVESKPAEPRPALSKLDEVLIDLMIQSADGQHGARDATTVQAILNEFVTLNSRRYASRYHLGFHAALTNQELPSRTGAENDPRRAWRVAGWLIGHFRREGDQACKRVDGLSHQDRAALLAQPTAAKTVAGRIIHGLANEGQPRGILPWIGFAETHELAFCIDLARQLIRSGSASDASALADAIADAASQIPPETPTAFALILEATLTRAAAQRALGRFDKAGDTAEQVSDLCQRLSEAPEEARSIVPRSLERVQAEAAAERLLCSMHVKDVDALWFTDESSPERIRQLLAPSGALLSRIVDQADTPSPAVAHCVALWCLLQPPSETRSRATLKCVPWLETLGVKPGAVALGTCTVATANRLWLLRALLIARDGGPMLAGCIDDIATYEASGGRLPFAVIQDTIECGLAEDVANVDQLIMPRLATDMHQFMRSGLLKAAIQKQRVVTRLRADLPELLQELPRGDAVAMVVALFGALAENGGKRQDLQAIGDELLGLVHEFSDGAADAIDALQLAGRGASIWGEDDYCAIDFELALHCRGTYRDNARARLMRRASVLERSMRHDEAEECLEMAEALGETRESTEGLRQAISRNRAANPQVVSLNAAGQVRRVRVLFVGGDDRQRKEQEVIRRLVSAQRRNVEIDFEHPGWGSNWSPKLDAAVRKLPKADMVVLLRFTRTIYGEKLRHAIGVAGKQWRPTYGHGAPAIARAIVRAANDFEG